MNPMLKALLPCLALTVGCSAVHTREPSGPRSGQACRGPIDVRDSAGLERLSHCATVDGDVTISAPDLERLSGLERLERVDGRLAIQANPELASLDGLEGLASVRTLVVAGNPALRDITALRGVATLGSAALVDNPQLESLSGIDHVHYLGGLVVSGDGIRTLHGLGGIHAVGDLVITSNPRLVTTRGIGALSSARHIDIESNPVLGDLAGLANLDLVATAPVVDHNALLPASERRRLSDVAVAPPTKAHLTASR